jgi:competence protein ComEA
VDGSHNGAAWRGYLALSLIWLSVLGGTLFITRRPPDTAIEIIPPPTAEPTALPAPTATPGPLHVDVAGAVTAPGVYDLSPGSIVSDAIAAAGGPAHDADLDRINKAVALYDGAQVFVPRVDQTPPPLAEVMSTPVPAPAVRSSDLSVLIIDLNTASASELDSLPGVGEAIARRIIEGRPYGSTQDLLRVKGIGEATLEKLEPFITVR